MLVAVPAAPIAGLTFDERALVCVNDKRVETEPEKGHKLVDFAGRCRAIPNDRSGERRARPPRPML